MNPGRVVCDPRGRTLAPSMRALTRLRVSCQESIVSDQSNDADPDRRREALRVAALGTLAFMILASYAFARPAVESLFQRDPGPEMLPWAWLATAGFAMVVTLAYFRYAARTDLYVLFAVATGLSCALQVVLLGALAGGVPGTVYALYVWKDVYIVVLIEIFWTLANTTYGSGSARWIYGLFCAMGSLGAIVGNLTVTQLVEARPAGALMETETVVWLVMPPLALAVLLFRRFGRGRFAVTTKGPPRLAEGLQVLRSSRFLHLLVLLIAIVQIVITFIDYEFNGVLKAAFPETNDRTAAISTVYAYINGLSLGLQTVTGWVVGRAGLAATLLAVPVILATSVAAFVAVPVFAIAALAKVASKTLDYSLFRATKEMLYIPLSYAEKTQGKAVVDVLTYRVAKGAASLLLLALAYLELSGLVSVLSLFWMLCWVGLTVAIVRRYRKLVNRDPVEAVDKTVDGSDGGKSRAAL